MADDNKVLFELGLDRAAWNQDAAAILSSAGDIDQALKGIIDQAGAMGRALGSIGDVSVKVDVNIDDLAAAETLIQGLGDGAVKINLDTSDIAPVQQSLADLAAANANVKIVADDGELVKAQGLIEDIDAAAPSVDVNADDTELDTAKDKVDDLDGETASVKVDADTSGADAGIEDVSNKLEDLKKLAVVDLVMQASGPALGILQQALDLVTSTDEAVRTLAARTGQEIPGAAQIIDDLYTANWGESKQQIAETLALASQLGIDQESLAGSVESAFQVASVTGEDVNEILRAQNTLVKNELAPNYQAAADLITAGFQTGANRGDDLLDTFNEYGSTFRQLNLDGSQALDVINSGLASGFENSDRVADVLRELGIRLTDINDTAAQEALGTLGLPSPAEGEALGADFLAQILAGIQNAAPDAQTELTRALFGTLSEDYGLQTILGLDSPIMSTFDTLDGRAQSSADIINDTLGGALNTLFRNVEVEAQAFLSSDQINLDQKIEDIKNGITNTLSALSSGEDLAGALEIGLAIPGFADSVHRFEASVGEFLISVLELIAGVQDFAGKDSSGTRGQIASLAETQLAFNLQVANPDEIAGEVSRALARGVNPEAIQAVAWTAATELIDEGNLERADALVTALRDTVVETASGTQNYFLGLPVGGSQTSTTALFDTSAMTAQLAEAEQQQAEFAQRLEGFNIAEAMGLSEDSTAQQENLLGRFTTAVKQTMETDVPTAVEAAATAVEDGDTRIASAMTGNTMTTSFETVGQVANSVMTDMAEVVGQSVSSMVAAEVRMTNQTNILKGAMLGLLGEVGPGILDLANNLQNIASGASLAAQTIGAATAAGAAAAGGIPEFASGGQASGLFSAGENGRELIFADEQVAVLNNQSTEALVNAVRSVAGYAGIPTGGGGGQTFNMVNNWYVPSVAVGASVSQQMAANIRGQGG